MAEPQEELLIRALVSYKEAGILIGKNGTTISNIRDNANVKISISKIVPNGFERIVTISGSISDCCTAVEMICTATGGPIRMLIAYQLAGSVIGKGGQTIKEIQKSTNARVVISKDMLPQSTERVVEVLGDPTEIKSACKEIAEIIIADKDAAVGLILFDPHHSQKSKYSQFSYKSSLTRKGPKATKDKVDNALEAVVSSSFAVSANMVAVILGPKGETLKTIRDKSGAQVRIASPDGEEGRKVQVQGSIDQLTCALNMLHHYIQKEKDLIVE